LPSELFFNQISTSHDFSESTFLLPQILWNGSQRKTIIYHNSKSNHLQANIPTPKFPPHLYYIKGVLKIARKKNFYPNSKKRVILSEVVVFGNFAILLKKDHKNGRG